MKGHAPSKAVLQLMGWTVFITNIGPEIPFRTPLKIYGLRWRIEVIFKAWKSAMCFASVHRVSAVQSRITLTARLIAITLGADHLYALCRTAMKEAAGRDLSLLQFIEYVTDNPKRVARVCHWLAQGASPAENTCHALRKYRCYEKRKRPNHHQKCRDIHLA